MTPRLAVGLNLHHDTSCAVISEHGIVAAEEERWSEVKHNIQDPTVYHYFPERALDYCLAAVGANPSDVTDVWVPRMSPITIDEVVAGRLSVEAQLVRRRLRARVHLLSHHATHVLSGVWWAGPGPVAALCIDGGGSPNSAFASTRERVTGYLFKDGLLHTVYEGRVTQWGRGSGVRTNNSLGHFYFNLAVRCIPRGDEAEGSMMALAAYGEPSPLLPAVRRMLRLGRQGTFELHPDVGNFRPLGSIRINGSDWSPAGAAERSLQDRANLAFAAQTVFEEAVVHIASRLQRMTDTKTLVFSGGCALNAQLNGTLARRAGFQNVYVPPAPHDAGTAVGAALAGWVWRKGEGVPSIDGAPMWGPIPGSAREVPGDWFLVEPPRQEELIALAVGLICRGAVLGLIDGGMEFGPRALGHRSIIALPSSRAIRDRVNELKARASFRPLAPAVLEDRFGQYFEGEGDPYMNRTAIVRQEYRRLLEGVTHRDGTARVQVVPQGMEILSAILTALAGRSLPACLMNTSLNGKGKPIVRSMDDGIALAKKLGLDGVIVAQKLLLPKDWTRRLASLRASQGRHAIGSGIVLPDRLEVVEAAALASLFGDEPSVQSVSDSPGSERESTEPRADAETLISRAGQTIAARPWLRGILPALEAVLGPAGDSAL